MFKSYDRYLAGHINESTAILEEVDPEMLSKLEKFLQSPKVTKMSVEKLGEALKDLIELDKQIVVLPNAQFKVFKHYYDEAVLYADKIYHNYSKYEELAAKQDKSFKEKLDLFFNKHYTDRKNWFPVGNAYVMPLEKVTPFVLWLAGLQGVLLPIDDDVSKAVRMINEWKRTGKRYLLTYYIVDKNISIQQALGVYLHELGHIIDFETPKDRTTWQKAQKALRTIMMFGLREHMPEEVAAWDNGMALIKNDGLRAGAESLRETALNSYRKADAHSKVTAIQLWLGVVGYTGAIGVMSNPELVKQIESVFKSNRQRIIDFIKHFT